VSVNSPLAKRMPGFDARHATRRARKTRVAATVVVLLAVVAFVVIYFGRGILHHSTPARRRHTHTVAVPRVTATLATWRLGAPISRAVVVPGTPGADQLVILGGETTGGLTASGVFTLDVGDGTLTQVGDLTTTLDDAAGAVLDGRDVVFGGTSSSTAPSSASVQGLPATAATAGAPPPATAMPTSTQLGSLPQPRAAATTVTVGTTTYLVGGDTTAGPAPGVLSTADGTHFVTVASLPVPVLYPAVAAMAGKLYVFGGVADSGTDAGRPVDTIQVVDLKSHRVTDSGRLPEPLTAAAAVVLGHDVLLAGGDTASSGAGTPPGGTGTSSSTTAPAPTSSVSTVWFFDPTAGTSTAVGQLPVAVSHASVAVLGSTAWLVGGESDGTPVSAVQSFTTVAAPTTTSSSTP
jgi:hypothetical protein